MNLSKLDNPADTLITLRISGNRLVSVCNSLQQLMYETKRVTAKGDAWEFLSDSHREVYETIEAIRDELAAQRTAANQADTSQCNLVS